MATTNSTLDSQAAVFTTRAHWIVLTGPVMIAVAAIPLALVLGSLIGHYLPAWRYHTATVAGLAGALLLAGTIAPILEWMCSTDTLTDTQLASRSGVLTRHTTIIPTDRIAAVNVTQTLVDRILGSGTLEVQTAGADSTVRLRRIPQVHLRQQQVSDTAHKTRRPQSSNPNGGW
jgi:uncharacterized membrane protein YdbT with pleckstrin-like domain